MLLQPPDPAPPADDAPIIDWGSVPDWIAGVSGFLAFVAAVIAVVYAVKGFRLQGKQIAALEADKRVEQASQVALSIERKDEKSFYHILNGSKVPVHAVILFTYLHSDNHPKSNSILDVSGLRFRDNIDPGSHVIEVDPRIKMRGLPGLFFVDSAGRAWIRIGASELIQLKRNSVPSLTESIPAVETITFDMGTWVTKWRVDPE